MDSINWESIYGTGTNPNHGIPMSTSSTEDKKRGNFRDFKINLDELLKEVGVEDLPVISIYCDTLQIDTNIYVHTGLFIFARRVVAPDGTTIVLSRLSNNDVPFTIISQEIVDANNNPTSINVKAVNDAGVVGVVSIKAKGQECGLRWSMNEETATEYFASDISPTGFYYGQPLQLSLMSIFSLATLVFTTSYEAAIKQLQWIYNLGIHGEDTRFLAAQAHSFCNTLTAKSTLPNGAILVPFLDLDIYKDKARASLEYLKSRETKYNNLQRLKVDDNTWSDQAKDMLQVGKVESNLYNQLEAQAQHTFNQAQNARNLAGQEIVIENNALFGLNVKFDRGVETWKEVQTEDAIKGLIIGVVKILAQIPVIVAVGPEMAVLPAVESLTETMANIANATNNKISPPVSNPNITNEEKEKDAKAVKAQKKKAAEAQANLIDAGNKIGQGASSIVGSAMKIYDIAQTAYLLENDGLQALNLASSVIDKTTSSTILTGVNVITGGEQIWTSFELDIENLFADHIDKLQIDGAKEYKTGFIKLIIAGKIFCETQVSLAKASTELAAAKMQLKAANDKLSVFQKRLEADQVKIANDEVTGILLYTKVLDAKRAVYLALDSYIRAAEYFTLKEGNAILTMPSMTSDLELFEEALEQIGTKENVMMSIADIRRMGSAHDNEKGGIEILFKDEQIKKQLMEHANANWQINIDNSQFEGYGRIRLNLVRVFLLGIKRQNQIKIKIRTSGIYSDINPNGGEGLTNLFVGTPIKIDFIYSGDADTPNPQFDGTLPIRYSNDFFQPTPFTTWTIGVSFQSGEPLDLSGLEGILLHLEGDATPVSSNI